ncbi:MAG: DsbA family protein [Candidatus Paceibacterota bacterium]
MEEEKEVVETHEEAENKPAYLQFVLPGSILIAALLISGTLIFTRNQGGELAQIGSGGNGQIGGPVEINVNSDDHVLGDKDAEVTIVEFSDFQCPFCRALWSGAIEDIKRDYIATGKARLVYKHYPLEDIHPGARPAAEASECAAEQGKFWEYHDKIFEEQEKLGQGTVPFTSPDLKKWAAQIGLDSGAFNGCLDSAKYADKVTDHLNQGISAGVSGTPATYINGRLVPGAQSYQTFKAVIDSFL